MKLLCTLALACLAVCSAAENLIGNPGFEMNPATGLPKMWTLSKGAVGEIVEGISGKNVLQVSGTEDGKRYWWLQSLNQIVPGHFYRLTGKVKGPAGMQTAVYVECSNPWKTISSGPGMAGNFSCHRISKTEPSALSGIAHDSSRQSPVCGFDSCKGKAPAGKSCEKSGFFPDRERRHPYALAFEQRSGGETGGGCLRREIWSSDDRRRTGEDGSFHAGRYPSQSRD